MAKVKTPLMSLSVQQGNLKVKIPWEMNGEFNRLQLRRKDHLRGSRKNHIGMRGKIAAV